MNLRPYQISGKEQLSASIEEGNTSIVFCLPTGAGKTVCFADIAKGCLASGSPVLIICNRKELIAQAKNKLNSLGLFPTLIIPSYKDKYSNLYLASVDTLRNRKLPDVKVVIIDEAHLKSFDEIALIYKGQGAIIIGCTATPIRSGKAFLTDFPEYTGQMADIYDDIVCPVKISDLIKEGFLCPAIYYGPEVDTKDIKIKGGEYDEKQVFEMFDKPKLYAGVVENYMKIAKGTKALVFNINVEHSLKMTAAFNIRGIPSEHVDGKTPDLERRKIFERFSKGVTLVLNNVAVATTGYDEPTIETIIINRCTASLSLFLQMAGRGGRPYDSKDIFTVIDQGGNVWKHGFWHQDRIWSLEKEYVSKTIGAAPIKMCQQCEALISASATKCEYCDYIQEKREKEKQLAEAEFGVIDAANVPKALKKELYRMTILELEQYREIKEYKPDWVANQLYNRGDQALFDYCKIKGYATAWAYRHIKIAEERRIKAKEEIWQYILDNQHLDESGIEDFAQRKLKATHSKEQIEILLPKIFDAANDPANRNAN